MQDFADNAFDDLNAKTAERKQAGHSVITSEAGLLGKPVKENDAGVAQLVERNLAKVEVTSSSLVTRSSFEKGSPGFPFSSKSHQRL